MRMREAMKRPRTNEETAAADNKVSCSEERSILLFIVSQKPTMLTTALKKLKMEKIQETVFNTGHRPAEIFSLLSLRA